VFGLVSWVLTGVRGRSGSVLGVFGVCSGLFWVGSGRQKMVIRKNVNSPQKKLSAFGFVLSAFKTAKPIFHTVYRFGLFPERKKLKLSRVLLLYFAYQLYKLQQAWILY